MTEENLPIQTVGHITGYCPGQRDVITSAHRTTWKTLQSDITQAAPKGWDFPSLDGEVTTGQLWVDNKMDEVCTMDTLWEATRDSETQKTLTPTDEETCKTAHDPRKTRQTKKEHFFKGRSDDITHHNNKKIWYLMEFKRTS